MNLEHYPSIFVKLVHFIRKWKLTKYKKKKVKNSKSSRDRHYYIKFKINIGDNINPQIGEKDYEIVIPAKAAFFAKEKLENSIKEKIVVNFLSIEAISDDEVNKFEQSREEYIKKNIKS